MPTVQEPTRTIPDNTNQQRFPVQEHFELPAQTQEKPSKIVSGQIATKENDLVDRTHQQKQHTTIIYKPTLPPDEILKQPSENIPKTVAPNSITGKINNPDNNNDNRIRGIVHKGRTARTRHNTRKAPINNRDAEADPNFRPIEEVRKIPKTRIPVDSSKKSSLLELMEEDFRRTQTIFGTKYKFRPYSLTVADQSDLQLNGILCQPANGYRGYYEAEKVRKKRVVLHFTVGNLKSDIYTLTKPHPKYNKWRNSVAFVMARDGNIYQLFNSEHWSHHLGNGTIGGNQKMSQESIGIEVSNYGPLERVGNELHTVYSKPRKPDVYCTLADTDKYIALPQPFKGYKYFAAFTDEQYESLIVLLRFLTAKYNIPRDFLSEHSRYKANNSTAHFKGINTHLNYRKTGKWDIGPAFDWNRVIKGVKAKYYYPSVPVPTRGDFLNTHSLDKNTAVNLPNSTTGISATYTKPAANQRVAPLNKPASDISNSFYPAIDDDHNRDRQSP